MTDLHTKLIKNEFGHVMSNYVNMNPGGNGQSNYGMGSSQAPSNSGSSKIKRYNLLDLFDDQYGHLQRNELLEVQKQKERLKQSNAGAVNIFIVGE